MPSKPSLTPAQYAKLAADIAGGEATRVNFYTDYAKMLAPYDPLAASLIMQQAQITTYSGPIGGAALYGNFLAKLADPTDYTNDITLDKFSYDIVKGVWSAVDSDYNSEKGGGILEFSDILKADSDVWNSKNLGKYFPGNIFYLLSKQNNAFSEEYNPEDGLPYPNQDSPFWTPGSVDAIKALWAGGPLGNTLSQYPKSAGYNWDSTSMPGYIIVTNAEGNVVHVDDPSVNWLGTIDTAPAMNQGATIDQVEKRKLWLRKYMGADGWNAGSHSDLYSADTSHSGASQLASEVPSVTNKINAIDGHDEIAAAKDIIFNDQGPNPSNVGDVTLGKGNSETNLTIGRAVTPARSDVTDFHVEPLFSSQLSPSASLGKKNSGAVASTALGGLDYSFIKNYGGDGLRALARKLPPVVTEDASIAAMTPEASVAPDRFWRVRSRVGLTASEGETASLGVDMALAGTGGAAAPEAAASDVFPLSNPVGRAALAGIALSGDKEYLARRYEGENPGLQNEGYSSWFNQERAEDGVSANPVPLGVAALNAWPRMDRTQTAPALNKGAAALAAPAVPSPATPPPATRRAVAPPPAPGWPAISIMPDNFVPASFTMPGDRRGPTAERTVAASNADGSARSQPVNVQVQPGQVVVSLDGRTIATAVMELMARQIGGPNLGPSAHDPFADFTPAGVPLLGMGY